MRRQVVLVILCRLDKCTHRNREVKRILERNATNKTLFAFGLNHKTAPVEIREKLYINEVEIPELLAKFKETLAECVILSTCNRTEIYGVSESPDIDLDFYKTLVIDFKNARGIVKDEHFFTLLSCAACQQLFNIAASVDSKIIGDTQILKQLREAYTLAFHNKSTGNVLNQLLQRGFKIGKRTYTETSIHRGAVSVSLAAVELAKETFGSLEGRTVMILGAGETARLTAEALISKKAGKILISNRTRARADEMLDLLHDKFTFDGAVIDFADFKGHLADADIVISSTGSEEPIIYKNDLGDVQSKMLLIDIAVPRDIDMAAGELSNVVLKNIDDLHSIVGGNVERRKRDMHTVKKLVMGEMVEFLSWYYALPLMPECKKTRTKPDAAHNSEMVRIKEFLSRNVSEIHKLAMKGSGDFAEDLNDHVGLVQKLQSMKAAGA